MLVAQLAARCHDASAKRLASMYSTALAAKRIDEHIDARLRGGWPGRVSSGVVGDHIDATVDALEPSSQLGWMIHGIIDTGNQYVFDEYRLASGGDPV